MEIGKPVNGFDSSVRCKVTSVDHKKKRELLTFNQCRYLQSIIFINNGSTDWTEGGEECALAEDRLLRHILEVEDPPTPHPLI